MPTIIALIAAFLLSIRLLLPIPAAASEPCPAHAETAGSVETHEAAATDTGSSATTEETASSETATQDAPSDQRIRFSEFLPNPVGSDTENEFIELENAGDTIVSLDGWSIEDSKGNAYALADSVLAPRQFLALPYAVTKLTLVNTGAQFSLIDQGGNVMERFAYGNEVKEGHAFARNQEGLWVATPMPTPGSENIFPLPESPTEAPETEPVPDQHDETEAPTEPESPPVQTPEEPAESTGDQATDEEIEMENDGGDGLEANDDGLIEMVAQVTLPPGVLGKTLFTVLDPQNGSPAVVRVYGKTSAIRLGDILMLRGEWRSSSKGPRFTSLARNMTIVTTESVQYQESTLAELDETDAGRPVSVSGTITRSGKHWIEITDEMSGASAKIRSEKQDTHETGDDILVKGTVIPNEDGIEISAFSIETLSEHSNDPSGAPSSATATSDDDGVIGRTGSLKKQRGDALLSSRGALMVLAGALGLAVLTAHVVRIKKQKSMARDLMIALDDSSRIESGTKDSQKEIVLLNT